LLTVEGEPGAPDRVRAAPLGDAGTIMPVTVDVADNMASLPESLARLQLKPGAD
jgi:hypothetical protein